MATIPQMKADEPTDEMARALGEAGCLVVADAFDAEVRAAVAQAMRPHLDSLPAEWIETDDPSACIRDYKRCTRVGKSDQKQACTSFLNEWAR